MMGKIIDINKLPEKESRVMKTDVSPLLSPLLFKKKIDKKRYVRFLTPYLWEVRNASK